MRRQIKNNMRSGKLLLFIFIFIFMFSYVNAYTIDYANNNVYIDTAQVKILVSPYLLSSSGCSYINITNKNNNGQYDLVVGSDANASVTSVGLWTSYTNGSNTSWYFAPQNITTIYTNYDNKTVWYETNAIQMNKNTDLYLQMCLNIVPGSSGKYDIGAHLSSQTLAQAISGSSLLLLDPWWNSTSMPEYNGNYYPSYLLQTQDSTSTTRIQPIYPLQNNLEAVFGGESLTVDELGRYTVTNTNTVLSNGIIGSAYNFTGSAKLIGTNTLGMESRNFSVSCWIYPNTSITDYDIIMNKMDETTPWYGWRLQYRSGTTGITWRIKGTLADVSLNANKTIPINSWTHVLGTYDYSTNNLSVYINGTFASSNVTNPGTYTNSKNFAIGSTETGSAAFDGLIDECKIYSTVLNQTQIQNEYNNGVGKKYQEVRTQQQFPYKDNLMAGFLLTDNNSLSQTYQYSAYEANQTIQKTSEGYNFSNTGSGSATQYLKLGTQAPPTISDLSVSLWIKYNSLGCTGECDIFSTQGNSANWKYFKFGVHTSFANKLIFSAATDNTNYKSINSTATLSTGVWYHVVAVKSGSNLYLYVNGTDVSSAWSSGGTLGNIASTNPFSIGSEFDERPYIDGGINATVKNLFVWNKSLSASDVAYLYNSGSSRVYNDTANQYYSNKKYSKTIEITNNEQDLNNVTVEVLFNTTTLDYSQILSNGTKIQVKYNNTLLNYWRKTWNTTGTSSLEILIPQITNNTKINISIDFNEGATDYSSESSVYPVLYDTFTANSNKWNIGYNYAVGGGCQNSVATITGGLLTLSTQASVFGKVCQGYAVTNSTNVPINFTKYAYEMEVNLSGNTCSGQGCLHLPSMYVTNESYTNVVTYVNEYDIPNLIGTQIHYYRDASYNFDWVLGNKSNASAVNFLLSYPTNYFVNGTTNPTGAVKWNLKWNKNTTNMSITQAGITYYDNTNRIPTFNKDNVFLRMAIFEDQNGVGVTSATWSKAKIKITFSNTSNYKIYDSTNYTAIIPNITDIGNNSFRVTAIADRYTDARIQPIYYYQDNLISYYDFDEITGGVTDNIGRYTLTQVGTVPSTTGKINNARGPFADANYIENAAFKSFTWNNSFSISSWINFNTLPSGADATIYYVYFLSTSAYVVNDNAFYLRYTGSSNYLRAGATVVGSTNVSSNNYPLNMLQSNTWYHVVFTYNSTNRTVKLYINANNSNSTDTSVNGMDTYGNPTSILRIGRASTASSTYSPSTIDEFSIYDKVLTQSEINNIYNNGLGRKYQQVNVQKQYPLLNSLSVYLKLDNNTLDEFYKTSGITYGTVPYQNGKMGSSAGPFSSSNYYMITTPFSTTENTNFTLSYWLYINYSCPIDGCEIIDWSGGTGYDRTETSTFKNNTVFFYRSKDNQIAGCQAATGVLNNQTWYYITETYDGVTKNCSIYVNGVFNASALNTAYTAATATTTMRIGASRAGSPYNFSNGWIDEFMIFNKTLSQTEISYLYNSGSGRVYNDSNVTYYNDSTTITTYGAPIVIQSNVTNARKYSDWFNSSKNLQTVALPQQGNVLQYQVNLTPNPVINNYFTSFGILSTLLSTHVPTINNVYMSPTTAQKGTTLTGYINFTDVGNDTSSYNYIWYKNGISNITGITYLYSALCYQESANISNQTGLDNSCMQLYTGTYYSNSVWSGSFPVTNIYDGNPSTMAWPGQASTTSTIYINYTKTPLASGAIWNIKNTNGTYNITVPDDCYNYDNNNLNFKVESITQ